MPARPLDDTVSRPAPPDADESPADPRGAPAGEIERAAELLREGGLVAFPTETVYGLGADARNETAVRRIFDAKGRPADHPLIVHLESADRLDDWATDVPDSARALARRFWPGPLTLILRRAAGVLDAVTGGQDTIGLRVPAHPVARALLRAFGGAVAAPSANRFGRISPTRADHVREELGGRVDLILDGGPCDVGIESTIVDLSGESPRILRPGRIDAAELEAALGLRVDLEARASTPEVPRAPGTLEAHYAPRTPLALVASSELDSAVRRALEGGRSIVVVALRDAPRDLARHDAVLWRRAPAEARDYARTLYATLRDLDASSADLLVVEAPPATPAWAAVRDRLGRAATGSRSGSTSPS